jgi:autonomous glycyl radical cofactor GrcA
MVKNIQKINIFMIVSFIFFSCSSAPHAGMDARASASSYEDGESAQRSRNESDERMVAYAVSMELSVKNPAETRQLISEQIKSNNGFIVKETEDYISTRIPSENMDNFLDSIKKLGKIKNESKTGTDITDQYRDNVIRLDSLKNVRNRYLALLEKANTINEILSIEKELERINLQIERLEGAIKHAELSVSYSIITVRFGEKVKPGPIGWIFYGLFRGIAWLFVWNESI